MAKLVSAIIPAFNESRRIGRAIESLLTCPLIDEIIVIDDGSVDNTAQIAMQWGAHTARLPRNAGKGSAMQAGIRLAKNETVLFCDGDMFGFTCEGIESVIMPVMSGSVKMVIGVRPFAAATRHVFPFLTQVSGFRALKKDCWDEIPKKFISGYQVELAINFVARRNNWGVLYTEVAGLKHTPKEAKYGLLGGTAARAKMIYDIGAFLLYLYLLHREESNGALFRVKSRRRASNI